MEMISSDDSNSPNAKDLSKGVVDGLGIILSSGEFSDFKIIAPTKTFDVHSLVLKFRSSYFKALFSNNWKEQTKGKLLVQHSSDVVSVVLNFIYKGQTSGISKIAPDVLRLATEWCLNELKDVAIEKCLKIIEHFETNHIIDPKRSIEILKNANLYDAKNLEDAAMEYIRRNIKEIKRSEDWLDFKKDSTYTTVFHTHFEECCSPPKRSKLP